MKINVILKKIKRVFKNDSKTLDVIHNYWQKPSDGTNKPSDYIVGEEKSNYLFEKIKKFEKELKILEIGCNVGRNLNYLYNNDYRNLSGVEISDAALKEFQKTFGITYENISIFNSPVETFLTKNKDKQYDLIYTMAVLEHIHVDSEWIFKNIVEQTNRYIITIEDESSISWKHFPRNYEKIFVKHGMKQIDFEDCSKIKGFHKGFIFRLFEKQKQL